MDKKQQKRIHNKRINSETLVETNLNGHAFGPNPIFP